MATLHEDWQELRKEIGNFVCHVEGTLCGANDIETLKKNTYEKGIKDGKEQAVKDYCKDCAKLDFYKLCNGNYTLIKDIVALNYDEILIVKSLVEKFKQIKNFKNQNNQGEDKSDELDKC